ncbi:GATA transcription factor 17-like, partial [Triticum urartu]|uniref:GATA transcription factor 17-like n=1 Tax=Triticum urartu TaxID=4572 RepID=UPI002044A031
RPRLLQPQPTTRSVAAAQSKDPGHRSPSPPAWHPNARPKSLCKACGIRYRKRRRVAMGLDPEAKRKPKRDDDALSKAAAAAAAATAEASTQEEDKAGDDDKAGEEKASTKKTKTTTKTTHTVELHMVGFAKDAVLKQRRRMRRKPSCLGEEERAAILLLSLSSGVIYA